LNNQGIIVRALFVYLFIFWSGCAMLSSLKLSN
jgi:hypothetical protein